jgi:class 3 adenylate cyclase
MEDRRLAAIVFTDIVGYSSMMAADENTAVAAVVKQREILQPIIIEHGGQWLKEMGDGTLSSFSSASRAVLCAIEIQSQLSQLARFKVRIGIHLGDIVFANSDVFGDGVNIAARIESVAEPGGIAISGQVFDTLSSNKSIETSFLGEKRLKNIDRSIRVYGVCNNGLPIGKAWREASDKTPKSTTRLVRLFMSKQPSASILATIIVVAVTWLSLSIDGQSSELDPPVSASSATINALAEDETVEQVVGAIAQEPAAPLSMDEPITSEPAVTVTQPSEQAVNPDGVFVTPVLESVPAFDAQSARSTTNTAKPSDGDTTNMKPASITAEQTDTDDQSASTQLPEPESN